MAQNTRKSKPWPCPSCGYMLAEVVYGQLYIHGDIKANTDGPNLVLRCPECENIKVWYANDRLSSILRELAREIRNIS